MSTASGGLRRENLRCADQFRKRQQAAPAAVPVERMPMRLRQFRPSTECSANCQRSNLSFQPYKLLLNNTQRTISTLSATMNKSHCSRER